MTKVIFWIFIFILLFAFLSYFIIENYLLIKPQTKEIKINNNKIIVEIADNRIKRETGLSFRDELPEDRGMLFVFEESSICSFWMKNMRFSIDIIWIDENLEIIGVEDNISPATYPVSFKSPKPAKYALEVNAGWAKKHNVRKGGRIYLEN